jgi:hypothetical protein
VILVGVSLATPAPDPKQIAGLTRKHEPTPEEQKHRGGLPDLTTSFVLAAVIGVLWIVFR